MTDNIQKIAEIIGEKRIKRNESLATHSIAKVAVTAELYLEIDTIDELVKIVRAAQELKVPIYMLGGGARIASTKDINGLVIKNNCHRFDKAGMKGSIRQNQMGMQEVLVYAEAGVNLNQLVRYTIAEGLSGLEYQLGLPGTVGGAIYTNAKYIPKYLMVNKALQSVRILHENGEIQTYNGQLPHFVYTDEEWEETKDIILSAAFKLVPADKEVLREHGEEAMTWRREETQRREDKS
ncbi:MAG: FAD-binding protein [Candidatus Levybacteria bacterium]|nr:FAD-binding protein [Candidatus Levybacteria bacterium]